MKRTLSLVLSLIMILGIFASMPVSVNAASTGKTGDCTWSLDGTVLTIGGNGSTDVYYLPDSSPPWYSSRNRITSVVIESGVKSIGASAFKDCTNLTSVLISNSVEGIHHSVFEGCTSLSYITIPDSVKSIGEAAFYDCTSLTSITIPDSVTSIQCFAFAGCTNLTSITIPASVTYIEDCAFGDNLYLKNVYYQGSYEQREKISIGEYNNNLLGAKWNYTKPSTPKVVAINKIGGVNVNWNSVESAIKYNVYRRQGGSSSWVLIGSTKTTSITDVNIKTGFYYIYSVRAYNTDGSFSDFDTNKTDTIQPVTAPTAVATNFTNGVQVKWNSVTGATKYNVYRRVGGSSSWVLVGTTTGTSLVDKGVTNGKYYVYSIRAINGTGYSAFDTKKTDTIQPITAPTAKVAKKSNGVQVSWNSLSGATKYNVYRRLGGTSTWIYVGTTTSTTLLDKGVVKGKSYAYSIRAINGTGYSAYDSSKCASIKHS